MAMVTPIGITRVAFDATESAIFSFTSVGGDQVYANELKIYDNTTGNLVYSNKVETYAFNQTLPANTLTNGNCYSFTFTTYDVHDNASNPSSQLLFYCYVNPTFEFTNISEGQQISNSSYNFGLRYSQSQGELINFVVYYLYDNNMRLVKQSDDIYSTETSTTVDFSYLINGLENDTPYYIQAKGLTLNGFQLETQLIHFTVRYNYPQVFTDLEIENLCDKGYNVIRSNVVGLVGKAYPMPPKYRNNSKLDLLDVSRQAKVYWENDNIIDGDFGMQIWYEVGLSGEQFRIISKNNPNTYMVGELVREIPYSRTTPMDYVQITGYVNGVESFYIRSNYVDMVNNTSYLILNFKYAPSVNEYGLTLNVYNQENNRVYWKQYKAITNNLQTSDTNENITDNDDRIIGATYGYELNTVFEEAPIITDSGNNIVNENDFNICARVRGEYSNMVYNRLSNIKYNDNNVSGKNKANNLTEMSGLFPIGKIELQNGIYDHIEFYKDYNRPYSTAQTTWSFYTYMLCNFNNNIDASSLEYMIQNIQGIKVKAREVGTFEYVTLFEKAVSTSSDFSFETYDYRVPNGKEIEYALVFMQNGGIEGQYITKTITSKWSRLFVSDDTMTLSLIGNVQYGSINKNSPRGILQPIDNIYPIVVNNGTVNYYSGTVSGTMMCDDYTTIDRAEIVNIRETWGEFLLNGKVKVIKDWNGNIFVGQITTEPSFSLFQTLGNSIGNISFGFVEQGKWNNQEDLYATGIVDIV